MSAKSLLLPRRTLLRGIGSTLISLPLLDAMLNNNGEALAQTGTGEPKRFLVCFAGQAIGADDDPVQNLYVPDTVGRNYDLKTALKPLANYGDIRQNVSVISGLRIPYGANNPEAGWGTDFHIEAMRPLLTGVKWTRDGVSSDQIVASAIGQNSVFKTLNFIVQASWYLSVAAPYGRDIMSFKRTSDGIVEVPPQVSPRAAFQSLFTAFAPPDAEALALRNAELMRRRSILDFVKSDAERLLKSLGSVDKQRIGRHFDEIRDLEKRLAALPPEPTQGCRLPVDPGADPKIGGAFASDDASTQGQGYSDEYSRARHFCDLLHMAFTCDLTRSATLMMTMAQSHMSVKTPIGLNFDVHELGHTVRTTEDVSRMLAWQIDHFAYLAAKLRDTPEGSSNVLANSALIFMNEGGRGFDPGSGSPKSTHSTEGMAMLLAGGAGGLDAGKHVVATGKHTGNVIISAMNAVGVQTEIFGEVTGGKIGDLFKA